MRFRKSAVILGVMAAASYGIISAKQKLEEAIEKAAHRWHVITINKPLAELAPDGEAPDELNVLSQLAEVELRPTADMKMTEIAAKLHHPEDGLEALRELRANLREAQMLLEAGEIITPDHSASAQPTLFNAPLRYIAEHRFGMGRL